ncbi:GNAT family N-acetyltransferase [Chimaeribacter californicus]|uniref:GNAT family N-acetyltransferase n=1 Tax=Chimaeribacter californicus TaxID=2060067 RepID=A0A2N5DV09_9GAMM|nr:GNAT family N-acetyltransferase [Chimaeribacter californicus]PLR30818.1 GNAT family N-acetyltransferase [Chimaeribacter californicus]
MSQTIRLAREEEAAELHALLQRAYAPLLAHNIHFTITRASVNDVQEVIRQESTFVLESEGQITATLTTRFPWTPATTHYAPWPFVHWFAVAEHAKGQGLGAQILTYVEETFLRDTLKVPAVYLATAISHPWLTGLYQRRGYAPFHTVTNPLGVELVYLRKILNRPLFEAQAQKEFIRTVAEHPLFI